MIAHGEEFYFTHFHGPLNSELTLRPIPEPDLSAIPELSRFTKQAGVAVTPNLVFSAALLRLIDDTARVLSDPETLYLDPDTLGMWTTENPARRENLKAFTERERIKYAFLKKLTFGFQDSGVLLLLGTDASAPGLFPGKSAHQEIGELVEAGLTPFEALRCATVNADEFLSAKLRKGLRSGCVRAGCAADLILVEANPLRNVEAVSQIVGVMTRGKWLPKAELERLRDRAHEPQK